VDHGPGIVDEVMVVRAKLGDEALHTILWDSPARLIRHGRRRARAVIPVAAA
jgi:hypothetical protein